MQDRTPLAECRRRFVADDTVYERRPVPGLASLARQGNEEAGRLHRTIRSGRERLGWADKPANGGLSVTQDVRRFPKGSRRRDPEGFPHEGNNPCHRHRQDRHRRYPASAGRGSGAPDMTQRGCPKGRPRLRL